jgi:anti-sigma28 factor (negative regulator of flagellin synthesis)
MNSAVTGLGLQHIDPLLALTPQTRADKIAQLRRAVESGTYCVSAEQIAEKMVRKSLVDTLTS